MEDETGDLDVTLRSARGVNGELGRSCWSSLNAPMDWRPYELFRVLKEGGGDQMESVLDEVERS